MGGKAPLAHRSNGTEFAKWQNFFFYRRIYDRNKDLYLVFDPILSLILYCCCFRV